LLHAGTVTEVLRLGTSFRRIQVRAPGARGWEPGHKIQVLLPGDDVRTYTPIPAFEEEEMTLLVYLQGNSPASRWAQTVQEGDTMPFLGPQRSLSLPDGPVTLVGDATSIAVAAAYASARPGQAAAIFAVPPTLEVDAALASVGLNDARVFRGPVDGALAEAVADAAVVAGGTIAITGGDALIREVRTALRARSVTPRVKAYWIAGRAGLD
jgi:NADPH-dependent ferric siderophore reductase